DYLFQPSFRDVLTSKAVWAVFIAAMGVYFVLQFGGVFSPQYYTSVLGYSPSIAGTLTIIPMIALLPARLLTGIVSDRLSVLSEVAKLRLFNSLASFIGAAFFAIVLFVRPSANDAAATALIMIPFVLLALTSGGFQKAAVLISREHAPFVFSVMHIFNMISLLAATFLIPLLTPDNTFIIVLIISNVFFTIFVKAEPEEWAMQKV
ncbi:hypothetical protein PENTCL1PPCAC_8159, partial [Pristionchus entomophagus]